MKCKMCGFETKIKLEIIKHIHNNHDLLFEEWYIK